MSQPIQTMREKILSYNQNAQTPAVLFLLSNLVKKPPVRRKRNLLLPKLKDNSFHYKSLNQSRVSSINNSIDSTVIDESLKMQEIASKSILSPKSSQQFNFLKEVESEKPIRIVRSHRSVSVQPRINFVAPSLDSIEQPSTRREDDSDTNTKFADLEPFKDPSGLADYLDSQQGRIMRALRTKDTDKIISIFGRALEICQDHNKYYVFSEIVYYLGALCLDCDQLNRAAFFFEQSLIIAEYGKNYVLKMNVLQQISIIATKLKKYTQAIELLKKSLIYAWVTNQYLKETLAYDMLGMNYFYSGSIKNATMFHEKYILADVEPQNGYFRKISEKFIHFYDQDISKTLMTKLSLPVKNRFEPYIDDVQPTCDQFRVIKYNNCDARQIVDRIVNGVEFNQYNLDYYQSKQKEEGFTHHKSNEREKLPRRIVEIKLKYTNHKDNYSFQHDIASNPLYDVNLDEQVEARMKKKFDLQKVLEKVIKNRGQDEPCAQIYMKHLQESRPRKESWFKILRKNKERILAIFKADNKILPRN